MHNTSFLSSLTLLPRACYFGALLVAIVIWTTGCATFGDRPGNAGRVVTEDVNYLPVSVTLDENTKATQSYMDAVLLGNIALDNQDFDNALFYFDKAATHTNQIAVIKKAALIALHIKNYRLLERNLLRWQKVEKYNSQLSELLLASYMGQGKLDLASELVFQLQPQYQRLSDKTYVEKFIQLRRYVPVSKIIESVTHSLSIEGHDTRLYIVLAKAHQLNAREDLAFSTMTKAINASPGSVYLTKMMAEMLVESAHTEKLASFLDEKSIEFDANLEFKRFTAEIYYKAKLYEQSIRSYQELIDQYPGNNKLNYQLGVICYDIGKYELAHRLFNNLEAEYRRNTVNYYMARILQSKDQITDALALYGTIEGGPFLLQSRLIWAQILAERGELNKALALLSDTEAKLPLDIGTLTHEKLKLHIDAGEFSAALKLIRDFQIAHPGNTHLPALQLTYISAHQPDQIPALLDNFFSEKGAEDYRALLLQTASFLIDNQKSELILARLLSEIAKDPKDLDYQYTLALLYESLENYNEMEQALSTILTYDPAHIGALNALGYSLAERGIRLELALTNLKKAHALAPKDPAVLDSLGWVYFKLGQYAQAEVYLKKAYIMVSDGDIIAHYGRLLWETNRQAEARKIWQIGIAKHSDNELLNQVVQSYP